MPLETLVQKFTYMRFDPEGITQNPEIPFAKSMPDYIMRWLASRFLDADIQEDLGIMTAEVRARKAGAGRRDVRQLLGHGTAPATATAAAPPDAAATAGAVPSRSPRPPSSPTTCPSSRPA